MRFAATIPPRAFRVGPAGDIELLDCGSVFLEPDEQVTFRSPGGGEYDVVRKSWGYYATPSLNGRLARFGLKGRLCLSRGACYLLLVEAGREVENDAYLQEQGMEHLAWLHDDVGIRRLAEGLRPGDPGRYTFPDCLCGVHSWSVALDLDAPPAGETRFGCEQDYRRRVMRCGFCGHFVSVHGMDLSGLYAGEYMAATYQDEAGLRRRFEAIMALPPERSDNAGRADRVADLAAAHLPPERLAAGVRLLDVGSGLGVFPAVMAVRGFACTALDPDPRAVAHAAGIPGVMAVQGEFPDRVPADLGRFDLVSLNKVLEHVPDPVAMLAGVGRHLLPDGAAYVELPDGEAALEIGQAVREEFFIEHLHIFSPASALLLAHRAGFTLAALDRLTEPSGKRTLRLFLKPGRQAQEKE